MIGDLFDSPWKILIVAVVLIVLFGSKKLPDAARSLGRSMRILKSEVGSLHAEDAELPPKFMEILVRQGVIERLIPGVQLDLAVSGRRNDEEDRDAEGDERAAHRRFP